MAAIKNRELQKPWAENNRMRYTVLFGDQWLKPMKLDILSILHLTGLNVTHERSLIIIFPFAVKRINTPPINIPAGRRTMGTLFFRLDDYKSYN